MNEKILPKDFAKFIEPHTVRWENILQLHSKKLTMMWMEILMVAKDGLLTSTFGKHLYQVQYRHRCKVWGISFNNYSVIIYRDKRGTYMQVISTMPKKQVLALIKFLHQTWKSDIDVERAIHRL